MAACPRCGDFDDEPVCSTCGYSTVTPQSAPTIGPRNRTRAEAQDEFDRVLDMLQFGDGTWDESKALFPMEDD